MGRGEDGQGFKKSVCSFLKATTVKKTGERTKKKQPSLTAADNFEVIILISAGDAAEPFNLKKKKK